LSSAKKSDALYYASAASPSLKNASEIPTVPNLESWPKPNCGRPSIIHEYCLNAIEKEHARCIWICFKKGEQ
jgi:hypothetical protein